MVKEDRIPLSVQGREGWMMIGGVALVVGVLTIPFQFNIPFVFTNWPGTEPFSVGMRMAFWGSIYVILYAMLFTIPVSIGVNDLVGGVRTEIRVDGTVPFRGADAHHQSCRGSVHRLRTVRTRDVRQW